MSISPVNSIVAPAQYAVTQTTHSVVKAPAPSAVAATVFLAETKTVAAPITGRGSDPVPPQSAVPSPIAASGMSYFEIPPAIESLVTKHKLSFAHWWNSNPEHVTIHDSSDMSLGSIFFKKTGGEINKGQLYPEEALPVLDYIKIILMKFDSKEASRSLFHQLNHIPR